MPDEEIRHDDGGWISGPSGPGSTGPFETSRQALQASVWYARYETQVRPNSTITANLDQMRAALKDIELGPFDHQIVGWLARWEPSTVTVITALIKRAREAGPVIP